MRIHLLSFALIACATAHPAQKPQLQSGPSAAPSRSWTQERAVLIRHATVMPAAGPAIEDGSISFSEGKIIAAGKDVPDIAGAEVIDARGMFVTPGIIDAHSHLGVYATPGTVASSDGNESTGPITAEVSAKDGFWPQDPGLRRAAAGGITSLLVLPGSANLIGGRGFPVKLHFGRTADEMRFPGAKDALKMACGENPKRVYGRDQHRAPATRMGNIAEVRKAFAAARDYALKLDHWQKKPGAAEPPPARNLREETLAAVMRGELLVQNHCYRADEMQDMLDVAAEFGFHIRAFHHAIEAYKIRDVLAREGVGVATWADWWGGKMEMWDGLPQNLALDSQAGVHTVVHSDDSDGIQRLNQEAAKGMASARAAGIAVKEEEALRWITLNPAWVMGVEERTGSLEPGKMADVVLWDRNPFSVYARAQRVWADGVVTYDARAGAAMPSDFELGEPLRASALQTPHPARAPALPSTDPALLPLEAAECTAIRNATGLDGRPASVVLRAGRIAAGEGAGCRQIDAQGRVLAPGFVHPWSELGLIEVSLEESANDAGPRKSETPIHASLRAADSINPFSALLPVARTGGITSTVSSPTGGLVSGQAVWMGLDGSALRSPVAIQVRLGLGGREAVGSTHGAALELLRELLDDAREYGLRRQDYEANRMRKVVASRLDLEALQPVLAGKLPLLVAADRVSDLRGALALAKSFGLRIIFVGAAEGWLVAQEIAAAQVPVVVEPTTDLPKNFDALASRADNAALLAAAGVRILIAQFGPPHRARTLAQEAGNAVAFGLPWEEAMRALTSNAAAAFGLDSGRLEQGARGDVVLWSGDPLELSSRAVAMWIGGKQVPLTTRQTALLEKYRTVP